MAEKKNVFDQMMGAKYTRNEQETEEVREVTAENPLDALPLPRWLEDVDIDQLLLHGMTLLDSYEELQPYIKKYGPVLLSYLAEKLEKS